MQSNQLKVLETIEDVNIKNIQGKCTVMEKSKIENLDEFNDKDDCYFYEEQE